eukprot:4885349-Alexandrium_andersonii.AAC.1
MAAASLSAVACNSSDRLLFLKPQPPIAHRSPRPTARVDPSSAALVPRATPMPRTRSACFM